jgi:5-methylcytosine-specific restriction endonuclease McrA
MPIDYNNYPHNWLTEIRPAILKRANNKCEFCGVPNRSIHPSTGSKVVLTIAHLDHDTTHNDPSNLAAVCQRCHFSYDHPSRFKHLVRGKQLKLEHLGQINLGL